MSEEFVDHYEDVRRFSLSGERERVLLDRHTECCFMWTAKNGDPVGVTMNYVVRDATSGSRAPASASGLCSGSASQGRGRGDQSRN